MRTLVRLIICSIVAVASVLATLPFKTAFEPFPEAITGAIGFFSVLIAWRVTAITLPQRIGLPQLPIRGSYLILAGCTVVVLGFLMLEGWVPPAGLFWNLLNGRISMLGSTVPFRLVLGLAAMLILVGFWLNISRSQNGKRKDSP